MLREKFHIPVLPSNTLHFFVNVLLEQVLDNFSQQSGAWHHCVFFLNNCSNQFVLMYAISVFEVRSCVVNSFYLLDHYSRIYVQVHIYSSQH